MDVRRLGLRFRAGLGEGSVLRLLQRLIRIVLGFVHILRVYDIVAESEGIVYVLLLLVFRPDLLIGENEALIEIRLVAVGVVQEQQLLLQDVIGARGPVVFGQILVHIGVPQGGGGRLYPVHFLLVFLHVLRAHLKTEFLPLVVERHVPYQTFLAVFLEMLFPGLRFVIHLGIQRLGGVGQEHAGVFIGARIDVFHVIVIIVVVMKREFRRGEAHAVHFERGPCPPDKVGVHEQRAGEEQNAHRHDDDGGDPQFLSFRRFLLLRLFSLVLRSLRLVPGNRLLGTAHGCLPSPR